MKVERLFGIFLYSKYALPDGSTIGEIIFDFNKAIELGDPELIREQVARGANTLKLLDDDHSKEGRICYTIVFDAQGELLRVKHKLELLTHKK